MSTKALFKSITSSKHNQVMNLGYIIKSKANYELMRKSFLAVVERQFYLAVFKRHSFFRNVFVKIIGF